jgi:hypothetical protein
LDGIQDVDRVFTAFINGIEPEELEEYIQKISAIFKRKKVFVTGAQLSQIKPKLPANFKVVTDVRAFKKYFGTLDS